MKCRCIFLAYPMIHELNLAAAVVSARYVYSVVKCFLHSSNTDNNSFSLKFMLQRDKLAGISKLNS